MDIIYSSSYDQTGIKDYAIFENVNLTQLNNKVDIPVYAHTQKYYRVCSFCVLHLLDSIAKHHIVVLLTEKLMNSFWVRVKKSPLLIKSAASH